MAVLRGGRTVFRRWQMADGKINRRERKERKEKIFAFLALFAVGKIFVVWLLGCLKPAGRFYLRPSAVQISKRPMN